MIARALATILVLLIMDRLSGPKQIAQMSFYDYISGITVGSLAASTSINPGLPVLNGLLAIVLFLLASIFMGWLSEKSMPLRRLLTGKPIVLIARGEIQWKGMRKARLNMNELLSNLRHNGYFNLDEVYYAILEPTGKLSVQPKGFARPPKTGELNLAAPDPARHYDLVIDGEILRVNLTAAGKNERWLMGALKAQGFAGVKAIALATLDESGALSVHAKACPGRA